MPNDYPIKGVESKRWGFEMQGVSKRDRDIVSSLW